ncbi:MAG: ATP-binding cassette domain-containing protein [Candidatus Heimdallarchaeota archaeon]|nr:ATP-binding cassette domain-containing protein [Candidatus Heimdallarchaeota archaeon]
MNQILRIVQFMRRRTKLAFIAVVLVAVLESLTTIASPRIVEEIINQVFYDKQLMKLIPLLAIAFGLTLVSGIFLFAQKYLNEYVTQKIIYLIRNKLYSKIQSQSIDFFDRIETGQLISRGTIDVNAIKRLMSGGFRIFLSAIILYVGIFVMIGIADWRILIIGIVIASILLIIMYNYTKRSRPLFRTIQNKFGDLNSVLSENIRGAKVIRAFATEDVEIEKFEKENQEYLDLNIKMSKLRSLMTVLFPFILSLGSFLIWFIGGIQVLSGEILVGTLVALNSYILLLKKPTRLMTYAVINYQEGRAALSRIFEIIDMEKKIKNKPDAIELENVKGKITFENITFWYREDQPPVLRDISLEISPGETVAFLGTTGSGKSTIVSLVPRFYDPQEGRVLIDDIDIRDLKIESLRKNISLVQQETFLYAKTIKENIAFAKPDATDEEIIRVAKIAQAHEFIQSFPNGYETQVGERGVTLSGGQKQRLTIARALLTDTPFLIMDDSSSALDFETEHQFQKAISELIKDRTTLIITQRLSTIKFASKIIVMDKGEIIEQGTHDELMENKGLYYYLYSSQLLTRKESLESKKDKPEVKPKIWKGKL